MQWKQTKSSPAALQSSCVPWAASSTRAPHDDLGRQKARNQVSRPGPPPPPPPRGMLLTLQMDDFKKHEELQRSGSRRKGMSFS